MKQRKAGDLRRVRVIADYQFGPGAGEALFPEGAEFLYSNTGRVRQVLDGGVRVATVRARDGRFTLSMEGGRRLHASLPPLGPRPPRFETKTGRVGGLARWRVTVSGEVAEEVAGGGNAFAKHVLRCDPDIRALDEVLVVDPEDRLLAVGQARLGSEEMGVLKRGVAVEIRDHAVARKK